jgi:ABC-type nitrate/sulfonate/bicarbonate transport system substrate-binding protein
LRPFVLLLAPLLLGPGVGCGPRGSSALTTIRIGTSSRTPLHAALGEVLERTDILAQHGLEGRFEEFERGDDQHDRCSRGLVDATFSCEVPAMVHLQQLPGLFLTGSPGALGAMALVVPEDSPVREPSELRGAVVQVMPGASSQLALDTWLGEAGIGGTVTVQPSRGRGEEAVAALLRGEAQAAVLWDPWLEQARHTTPLRTLAEAPFWSVVVTYADRHDAETWQRYHRALEDALGWAEGHPDVVARWAAERGDMDLEVARTVLLKNDYVAGRAEPSLEVLPPVEQRLEACERWALQRGMVQPDFSLSQRKRPVP